VRALLPCLSATGCIEPFAEMIPRKTRPGKSRGHTCLYRPTRYGCVSTRTKSSSKNGKDILYPEQ